MKQCADVLVKVLLAIIKSACMDKDMFVIINVCIMQSDAVSRWYDC